MRRAMTLGLWKWLGVACILAMSASTAIAQEPAKEIQGQKPAAGAAKRASIYDKAADAKARVEKACGQARHGNKRVLVMFGAPWCGWCHTLHDWLAQPDAAAILDRDFIIAQVDIDRMTGGQEVMNYSHVAPSNLGSPS